MDNPISENLELYNFMKELDLFKMLSKNALWPLVNLAILRHFEPNELIISENSDPTGIFVVYKGTVQVFKTLQDGSEFVITQLEPGQIIGEISVIDKLKTTASVKALEKVECIFISEWDFTTQIHAYPDIGLQLLPVLTHRIRIMYEKIK
ncbi:cyclic nucleotide-binding protein [Legionella santicrucis]|uniref:Cyclic nucleotide-binding protein n=1 Tax=Legionella santicrucis TaxID=45074 RepID=A0A0W0YFU8_9GAMM|nr:cyclic nucleotide-binding domain-containing protein [Legionella santicrucis]KTD55821.1 cyclic nucleotide-binding protein [Legionella santicrucis]